MESPEKVLSERNINKNPFEQFSLWYNEALNAGFLHPDAMTLAASTKDGKPSARIVLLKSFDDDGFIFFTNYSSKKGKELIENPFASLMFYWDKLDKQVRIEGSTEMITKQESEEYFHSRPRGSQLGALASEQSRVIENRRVLEDKFDELNKKFEGKEIPMPVNWGGFKLIPDYFEFWQSQDNRLHDRICYVKENDNWKIKRLAP
jgi:pyridoxamine 5'-phosphate oxidase